MCSLRNGHVDGFGGSAQALLGSPSLRSVVYLYFHPHRCVSAMSVPGEYPNGTVIAGIQWRSEFTELDVQIGGAQRTYNDLNLVIQPDFPIAKMAQTSNISGVSFEDKLSVTAHEMLIEGATGNQRANPLVLVATDEGYRVRCEKLPAGAMLKIVMAIVDVKWNPSPPQERPDFGIFDMNYLLRFKMSDGGTYWYGHPEGEIYTPRPSPQHIKVFGDYVASQRRRTFFAQIEPVTLTRPQPPPAAR
jgi:hypothetical protein